jgi:ribosome-associated toxin RatA of RatAB toxin-antitoxin module
VYKQQQQQQQQQDAENPFLDPPFSRIKSTWKIREKSTTTHENQS